MSTEDITIICLTAATLIVTSLGIWFGWRWHKATTRQNAQAEINRINSEIYQIDREIERLEGPIKGVYGIHHDVTHTNQICNLKARKRNLEEQRKTLEQL